MLDASMSEADIIRLAFADLALQVLEQRFGRLHRACSFESVGVYIDKGGIVSAFPPRPAKAQHLPAPVIYFSLPVICLRIEALFSTQYG